MLCGFNYRFLNKPCSGGSSPFHYVHHLSCSPCVAHTLFSWTLFSSTLLSLSIFCSCFRLHHFSPVSFVKPALSAFWFLPVLTSPYYFNQLFFLSTLYERLLKKQKPWGKIFLFQVLASQLPTGEATASKTLP